MIKWLDRAPWTRPTDKMAVYTEIEEGRTWGIRVTLLVNTARVEIINGPRCTWYKAPPEISKEVRPPTFFERLRRITFEDKLREEVEIKREAAKMRDWENVESDQLFNKPPSGQK